MYYRTQRGAKMRLVRAVWLIGIAAVVALAAPASDPKLSAAAGQAAQDPANPGTGNSTAPQPVTPSEIIISNNQDGKTAEITVISRFHLRPNQDASITPGVADVTSILPSVSVICQPSLPCAQTGPQYQLWTDAAKKGIVIHSTAAVEQPLQVSYRRQSTLRWNLAKHEIHLCTNADITPANVQTRMAFSNPPPEADQTPSPAAAGKSGATPPAGTTTATTTTTAATTTTTVTTTNPPAANGSASPKPDTPAVSGTDWKDVKVTLKQSTASGAIIAVFEKVTLPSGASTTQCPDTTQGAKTPWPIRVRPLFTVGLPGLAGRTMLDGAGKENLVVTGGFLLLNDQAQGQVLLQGPVEIWKLGDPLPTLTGALSGDLPNAPKPVDEPVRAAKQNVVPFAAFVPDPEPVSAMNAATTNAATLIIRQSGQRFNIIEQWKITYKSENAPGNGRLLYVPPAEDPPADWSDATPTYFATAAGTNSTFSFVAERTLVTGITSKAEAQPVVDSLAVLLGDMFTAANNTRKAQAVLDTSKKLFDSVSAWPPSELRQAALRQYTDDTERQKRAVVQYQEATATTQLRFLRDVQTAREQWAH
jgi:hypothetical protein